MKYPSHHIIQDTWYPHDITGEVNRDRLIHSLARGLYSEGIFSPFHGPCNHILKYGSHTIHDHKGSWESTVEFTENPMAYFKATIGDDALLKMKNAKQMLNSIRHKDSSITGAVQANWGKRAASGTQWLNQHLCCVFLFGDSHLKTLVSFFFFFFLFVPS